MEGGIWALLISSDNLIPMLRLQYFLHSRSITGYSLSRVVVSDSRSHCFAGAWPMVSLAGEG